MEAFPAAGAAVEEGVDDKAYVWYNVSRSIIISNFEGKENGSNDKPNTNT